MPGENGHMKTDTPENITVYDRFLSLVQRSRRTKAEEHAAPLPPTADQLRAGRLEPWLRSATCETDFLPWLDSLIAAARANAHLSITNHAETVRWLGVEEGLTNLLDEVLKIRGQSL